jgi:hypothetical protein
MVVLLVAGVLQAPARNYPPQVLEESGKTYLVDRTGEHWDITQARSLGFKPQNFQYGIGRHRIKPLTDASLTSQTRGVSPDLKVIGVAADSQAQAYSITRLTRHEIINGWIGTTPIAAAY